MKIKLEDCVRISERMIRSMEQDLINIPNDENRKEISKQNLLFLGASSGGGSLDNEERYFIKNSALEEMKSRGVEYLDWKEDFKTCIQYVFSSGKSENFLHGILEHEGNPVKGDTVIYAERMEEGSLSVKYLGVYQGNNQVISKWGEGPVYRHFLENVIPEYGNVVIFSTYKPFDRKQ